MGAPGFWDDQATATRVSTEHSRLTRKLERYESLRSEYEDATEFLELGEDRTRLVDLLIPGQAAPVHPARDRVLRVALMPEAAGGHTPRQVALHERAEILQGRILR